MYNKCLAKIHATSNQAPQTAPTIVEVPSGRIKIHDKISIIGTFIEIQTNQCLVGAFVKFDIGVSAISE
jgi:hypothetical protein